MGKNQNSSNQNSKKYMNGRMTPPEDSEDQSCSSEIIKSSTHSLDTPTNGAQNANILNLSNNNSSSDSKLKVWTTKDKFDKTKNYVNHSLVSLKILKSKMREVLNQNINIKSPNKGVNEMNDFKDVEITIEKVKKILDTCYQIEKSHISHQLNDSSISVDKTSKQTLSSKIAEERERRRELKTQSQNAIYVVIQRWSVKD